MPICRKHSFGRRRQHRLLPLATRRAAQPQEQTHVFESGDFARTRRTPLASNRPPNHGRDHRSRAEEEEEEEEEEEKEEEKKEMSSTMVMVHPVPYGGETFLQDYVALRALGAHSRELLDAVPPGCAASVMADRWLHGEGPA